MGFEPTSTLFTNKLSTIWPNWSNDWAVLWVLIFTAHLTVICYYVMYAFQSESTLYSCLNIKEVNWQQWDSDPLSSKMNSQPFSETSQIIELFCEYLFVQCIWLYVIIMSCTCFKVNLHSVVTDPYNQVVLSFWYLIAFVLF